MAKYNHTTIAEFRSRIYEKLGAGSEVYWPSSELDLYIEEALHTFGALSGFWKDKVLINTELLKTTYDLFTDSSNLPIIKPTLTYKTIIDWINPILFENISAASPNSEFINLAELLKAIERKINSYQLLTSLILTKGLYDVAAGNNEVLLKDETIDIVKLTFIDETAPDSPKYILQKADEAELSYWDANVLNEAGTPIYYSTVYGSPNSIKMYPTPNVSGKLETLTIDGESLTNIPTEDTIINLPNNLVPYIKHGVLYDTFSKDGVFKAVARAQYYKKRWEEGIIVGRNYTSVLTAKADEIYIQMDSMNNVDTFIDIIPSSNPPTVLGFAGFNIFQPDIIPDANIHSIELLLITNASIDANFIDVELDYVDILASYVVHLAQAKAGVANMLATDNLKSDFIKISLSHNSRMQNKGITYENLLGITKKEEIENPRIAETV
jgi:hypothetical protein